MNEELTNAELIDEYRAQLNTDEQRERFDAFIEQAKQENVDVNVFDGQLAIDYVYGVNAIRKYLAEGGDPEDIFNAWRSGEYDVAAYDYELRPEDYARCLALGEAVDFDDTIAELVEHGFADDEYKSSNTAGKIRLLKRRSYNFDKFNRKLNWIAEYIDCTFCDNKEDD